MKGLWRRSAALDEALTEAKKGAEDAARQLEQIRAQRPRRERLGRGLTVVADRNALAERIAAVLLEGRRT